MKSFLVGAAALCALVLAAAFVLSVGPLAPPPQAAAAPKAALKAGASAIAITPFGQNPDWDGTLTPTGVWGEKFEDKNGNGKWDGGEPFEDDPVNTDLDPDSKN
ncbi:MAG: hypothetical protein ABI977_18695, partial [Acidobacteriota bacterium]